MDCLLAPRFLPYSARWVTRVARHYVFRRLTSSACRRHCKVFRHRICDDSLFSGQESDVGTKFTPGGAQDPFLVIDCDPHVQQLFS